MSRQGLIENGVVVDAILATPAQVVGKPGTWVDMTSEPDAGVGWTYSGGVFTAPVVTPEYRTLLTGSEWVLLFTDAEWDWLGAQRKLTTNAGKQLNKFMDAIRWTDSINVASPKVDQFYNWLLDNGIPGGQGRINVLRAGILE